MVHGGGVLVLVEVVLLVSCVLHVVPTPEGEVRKLPELRRSLLVVVLPVVGGIAELVAGSPQDPARSLPSGSSSGGKRSVSASALVTIR